MLIIVSSLVLARLRKSKFEDELIESWNTFRKPQSETAATELEGGAVDGAREVVNDLWSKLEEEEGLN